MTRTREHGLKRVACATLVATIGWLAMGQAAAPPLPPDPLSHSGLPSVLQDVNVNTAAPGRDATVTTPSAPAGQALSGDGLYQFVLHHATTHYVVTPTARNLARWRGGKQSICPLTGGLDPGSNAYVTARLRAVAAYVGAPVDSDPQCRDNVQVLFTSDPAKAMDEVMSWATRTATFGNRYTGGMRDLLAYRGDHAIQGWYITTRAGSAALNTDVALLGLDVLPLWPQIEQKYLGSHGIGTHLGGGSGSGIGIGSVILIVDTTRTGGYDLASLADYVAMLTLSLVQSPEHCDALPSILDLTSPGCATRPSAITAADLAFLKALYYRNTGFGPSLSRVAIESNMTEQFARR